MKRKALVLLLCFVFSIGVMACGNNEQQPGQTEPENTVGVEDVVVTEAESTEIIESSETTESVDVTETVMETFWDKVGIADGVGTVYNGETVELEGLELSAEEIAQGVEVGGIFGSYVFKEPADFLQFVEVNISYQDVNVKVWLLEHGKNRISLSGNYELKEIGHFNDYGRAYDLIVDGKCIASFDVEGDSLDTPLEECELYSFWVYPTEGLVFNGYEFTDLQMEGVVNHFGNPLFVSFDDYNSGNQSIIYIYREEISVTILENVSCGMSDVVFETQDGKNIERIDVRLTLTEKEILAQREWTEKIEGKKDEESSNLKENEGEYKELESVPVDGRDGSLEHPYQVGDAIHFPKVYIAYNYEYLENVYVPLTITVEEVTSDYTKVTYEYGVDNWEELDWANWDTLENSEGIVLVDSYTMWFKSNGENNEEVIPLSIDDGKSDYFHIEEADKNKVTLYYRDDIKADKKYIMIVYRLSSLPEEEQYPYFNCTFVELP